jgi:hypothetical protein
VPSGKRTWEIMLLMLATLPVENSLEIFDITHLEITSRQWDTFWAEALASLDRTMSHQRFAHIQRLVIRVAYVTIDGESIGDIAETIARIMPSTSQRGVLQIILIDQEDYF